MLFIYWLEDNPQYAKRVQAIHSRMKARGDPLLTGTFTVGELLAGVFRKGASERANEVVRELDRVVTEMVPFGLETARHYGHIRGLLTVPAADAIHLAAAAQARSDLFLTNDKRFVGKFVPGIQFVASIDDDFF